MIAPFHFGNPNQKKFAAHMMKISRAVPLLVFSLFIWGRFPQKNKAKVAWACPPPLPRPRLEITQPRNSEQCRENSFLTGNSQVNFETKGEKNWGWEAWGVRWASEIGNEIWVMMSEREECRNNAVSFYRLELLRPPIPLREFGTGLPTYSDTLGNS